jgi:DNA repair protein SbcC/Rad50
MIPVHLRVEGLYSYREATEIDFGPLLDAHLFGIFGAVGSGKSSLLEAITFALYGRVERLNLRENMAANMINLDASRARIDFTFDSLTDGHRYRVTVIGKRTKSAASFNRTFERLEELAPVPVSEEDILQAVGLSYDHFTRTVIVPQGKFQAFLMLSDRDRTDMLQELFRLERFDLSAPLGRLRQDSLYRENTLQAQMQMLREQTDIPEEELLRAIAAWQEEAGQLQAGISRMEMRCQEATRYLSLYREREEKSLALRDRGERLALLQARETAVTETYEAAQRAWETIPALRQEVQWAELAQQAREAVFLAREAGEKHTLLEKDRLPLTERLKEVEKEVQAIRENLRTLESEQADPGTLLHRQQYRSELRQCDDMLERLTARGKSIASRQTEARKGMEERVGALVRDAGLAIPEGDMTEEILAGALIGLAEQAARTELAIGEANQRSGLDLLASRLKGGDPCPLCGSTHHPDLHQPGSIPALIRDQQLVLRHIRKQESLIREALAVLREAAVALLAREEELARLRLEFRETEQRRLELLEKIHVDFADLSALEHWLLRQTALEQELRTARIRLDERQQAISELQQKHDSLLEQQRHWLEKQARQSAALETLLGQIPEEQRPHWREKSSRDLETDIQDRRMRIAKLEEAMESARRERESQTLATRELQSAMEILQQECARVEEQTAQSARQLEPLLESEGLPGPEELSGSLSAWQNERTTLRSRSEHIRGELRLAEDRLQRLRGDLEQLRLLQEEGDRLRVRLDNLRTLDKLFRGKGMVEYAASRYLRQIIEHANQRFHRMTRQKLRMELGEDNRIMVRDYYHGGAVRLIKTLSGGQLFQASLALALSLAEHIRRYREGQRDFFFLDEGFGTQDRDSLLIVLETLRALRAENRSVGLISHVEELKQEVGAWLNIEMDPLRGSRITGNY